MIISRSLNCLHQFIHVSIMYSNIHYPILSFEMRNCQKRNIDAIIVPYALANSRSIGDLAQFISDQNDVDCRLFSRNCASVPKKDIKLFLFQLIAWEILMPQYILDTKSIVFITAKIRQPAMFMFQSINAWRNIPCF